MGQPILPTMKVTLLLCVLAASLSSINADCNCDTWCARSTTPAATTPAGSTTPNPTTKPTTPNPTTKPTTPNPTTKPTTAQFKANTGATGTSSTVDPCVAECGDCSGAGQAAMSLLSVLGAAIIFLYV